MRATTSADDRISLVDLLDRLLATGAGVVLTGDVVISRPASTWSRSSCAHYRVVRADLPGRKPRSDVDELGLALMRLEEGMERLKSQYDLTASDLNLDLGP